MRPKGAITPDTLSARVAANQHGVVSMHQLLEAGLHPRGVTRRGETGRLHRVHRGVYAVGHAGLSQEGSRMRAGAVLSHSSAGALWRMLPPSSLTRAGVRGGDESPIDVTIPGNGGRKQRRGLVIHRSSTLLPSQTTRRAGIPVTKPGRTLEDLRRVLPRDRFAAALRQAEFLRLPLGDRMEPDHTRSELEARFLRQCRRHRLPKPEVNVRVGSFVVDFLWPQRRLIVELDGWESHGRRSAFEADRARDVRLKLLDYEVVRFTWRQVVDEPKMVASTVRALLAGPGV